MERRTIKMNSFVVILSILSVILEYTVYYFTDLFWPMAALTILTSLITAHILLEASLTYETGLLYSVLTVLLSSICSGILYFNQTGGLLVYRNYVHMTTFLHWFIPMLYYILRCLLDKGPRFVGFNSYFSKASIVFGIYYICNVIYHTIVSPLTLPYAFDTSNSSLIPFFSTATHIEDFIYMGTGIDELLLYALKIFTLFAPMGFYSSLLLADYDKKMRLAAKTAVCLLVPILFEGISVFQGNVINIDSCLYRFLSLFLGVLLFKLLNFTFLSVTGENFLHERNQYSFFRQY